MRTRLRFFFAAAVLLLCVSTHTVLGNDEEDGKRRAIRLKTTGQLKKIFAELEINYQETMTKTQLQELAFEENAVERWLELHPEKRRKSIPKAEKPPEGMDPAQWERIMAQMRGQKQSNFDHIADPERRAILTKLAAAGLVMPGSEDMDIEKLRNLGKILDDIPNMAKGESGDEGAKTDESGGGTKEEDVQEL